MLKICRQDWLTKGLLGESCQRTVHVSLTSFTTEKRTAGPNLFRDDVETEYTAGHIIDAQVVLGTEIPIGIEEQAGISCQEMDFVGGDVHVNQCGQVAEGGYAVGCQDVQITEDRHFLVLSHREAASVRLEKHVAVWRHDGGDGRDNWTVNTAGVEIDIAHRDEHRVIEDDEVEVLKVVGIVVDVSGERSDRIDRADFSIEDKIAVAVHHTESRPAVERAGKANITGSRAGQIGSRLKIHGTLIGLAKTGGDRPAIQIERCISSRSQAARRHGDVINTRAVAEQEIRSGQGQVVDALGERAVGEKGADRGRALGSRGIEGDRIM